MKCLSFLQQLTDKIFGGDAITRGEADYIASLKTHEELVHLMSAATVLRNFFKGGYIDLCGVVNAKSGRCTEDCIFCAQSSHYKTSVKTYALLSKEDMVRCAVEASQNGARRLPI